MNEHTEQKTDGPKKQGVSERKRMANRRNAQHSTGPRTRAGKDKTKMNAVTHGILCDELIIRNGEGREDLAAFERLLAGLREHYRPVRELEKILVEQIVGYLWKQRRAQRHENGAIQRQIERRRHLETLRSKARFREALATGAGLEQSVDGIQYLLDELERVIDEVGQGGWSTNSFNVLTAHFRDRVLFPPAPAKPIDSLSEEIDRKQLVKELKAQRSRLRERVPEVEATEAREAAARVQSYMLPAGHELELVLRYEAALDRKLHKVMDRLRQIQADRRAAEAADAAEGDQPAAAG